MIKKIKVKNSGIIKPQFIGDFPDGNLLIVEARKNIPFDIKRVYVINNLFNKKSCRGFHAHKKLEQVIFCLNGRFILNLDDGQNIQKISMDSSCCGLRLRPKLWHTMTNFSSDCVILVLANDYYKETDYIRKYEDFIKYINK